MKWSQENERKWLLENERKWLLEDKRKCSWRMRGSGHWNI